MKTVIVLDCSALAYSAFYAFGHLSYAGTETGIIYGFLSKLKNIGERFQTNEFILCWDSYTQDLHRSKDYEGYKQKRQDKRKEMSEDDMVARASFLDQIDILRTDVIPGMGFKNNYHITGYEADDLLAVWAKRMFNQDYYVVMVTSDQDMYQCLDCCDMLSLAKNKNKSAKLFTAKDLKEQYGVAPCDWPFAKAIGGCDGDGVTGIHGVSDPKKPTSKALKYICGELKKGVAYDRIISKEGQAIIKKNLPIVTAPYKPLLLPRMIRRRNTYTIKKFILTFERFGFRSFLEYEQLLKWKKVFLNE